MNYLHKSKASESSEQNGSLGNQLSSMQQVQQTPIIDKQPAARAVTFTPIAVNTLTANYPVCDLFQQTPTCASVQPIGSSSSSTMELASPLGVAVPHSVVSTSVAPATGSLTAIARAGMSTVLNQSTSSSNVTSSSTPLLSTNQAHYDKISMLSIATSDNLLKFKDATKLSDFN